MKLDFTSAQISLEKIQEPDYCLVTQEILSVMKPGNLAHCPPGIVPAAQSFSLLGALSPVLFFIFFFLDLCKVWNVR